MTRLRLPDQQRSLWIDGICINQEASGERSHQVKLMKAVYSNAEQVLVWLGDGGQTSAVAVNKMHLPESWQISKEYLLR